MVHQLTTKEVLHEVQRSRLRLGPTDMSGLYEIGIRGALETNSDWFPEMRVENREDAAVLRGTLIDQSALHGILATLRDLNLELLFIRRLDAANEGKEQT